MSPEQLANVKRNAEIHLAQSRSRTAEWLDQWHNERLSLETASYVPTRADLAEQELVRELQQSMNLDTRCNLIATEYGTRFEAPYDATAVALLKTIGAQWNREERVWMVKSDRHDLAVRIAHFTYDTVTEYTEYNGEISYTYPDAD